eukprot:m.802410 g.802410  ORF g.802410 m.802410 type:complete len:208 (-) comp23361_c1_seq70:1290-1913(-)
MACHADMGLQRTAPEHQRLTRRKGATRRLLSVLPSCTDEHGSSARRWLPRKTFTKHDMTAQELHRRLSTPPDVHEEMGDDSFQNDGPVPPHTHGLKYSWAGKVDDWGVDKLLDVVPLDPFMVLNADVTPENEHLFRDTRVWLSPAGTATPTHYDISHNFFVQIAGQKRVLLFPPQAWQSLYLWPVLHTGWSHLLAPEQQCYTVGLSM